ncbi:MULTISPECIES: hypothetical protein [unclassified Bradyrhizobium]|nr:MULTISPECIES: hypothetical protein [unclassified Bradyrhizobium]MCP3396926.1 hypothetical protein [Bradyrhizobium sp. CCGB20]MCP3405442.1 hypothetical protein [Bradyrhizobium sp. CCGB01]
MQLAYVELKSSKLNQWRKMSTDLLAMQEVHHRGTVRLQRRGSQAAVSVS